MDRGVYFGGAIALIFFFAAYAVKGMPTAISWFGMTFGLVIALGLGLPATWHPGYLQLCFVAAGAAFVAAGIALYVAKSHGALKPSQLVSGSPSSVETGLAQNLPVPPPNQRHAPSRRLPHQPSAEPSTPPPVVGPSVGTDSVVYGRVAPGLRVGDRSVVVGATDERGHTIIPGGTAVGYGAKADPTSVAIGSGAGGGASGTRPK